MIAGTATDDVVNAAASALGSEERVRAGDLTRLSPARRTRIIADCLYEDGFEEINAG